MSIRKKEYQRATSAKKKMQLLLMVICSYDVRHVLKKCLLLSSSQKLSKLMAHEIEVQWMGKMQFNALVNGHTIIMDAPERAGGEDNGPIPKPLVLTALAGCSGMDIAAILRKAGKDPYGFEMKVTGEISKKAPIEYTAIHIMYDIKGGPENKEATLNAVTGSQEKYCGV